MSCCRRLVDTAAYLPNELSSAINSVAIDFLNSQLVLSVANTPVGFFPGRPSFFPPGGGGPARPPAPPLGPRRRFRGGQRCQPCASSAAAGGFSVHGSRPCTSVNVVRSQVSTAAVELARARSDRAGSGDSM